MKKLFWLAVLLVCVSHVRAQERFFLFGKVLDADGLPLPSASVSLSTVIEHRLITSTDAGPDGSFRLVVTGHVLAMMTFSGAGADSFMLPLLLTTEQRTLNVTVRLARSAGAAVGIAAQHASLQIQYGNTVLGIAEKLMGAMMEEKRLAGTLTAAFAPGGTGKSGLGDAAIRYPDPDSALGVLAERINEEQDPVHREAFLLRYMQLRTETKRAGDPSITAMVLGTVEPQSPFWSLVPELIRTSASTPKEYAEYVRRVRSLTPDPELKTWLESHN